MKRFIYLVILTLSTVFLAIPATLSAAQHNIGLYGFYAWWEPSFGKQYDNFKNDPVLVIGPLYSVTFFDQLSFSVLFCSNLIATSRGTYSISGDSSYSATPYKVDLEATVMRTDLDLTVSYRFTKNFGAFIGLKMIEFEIGEEDSLDIDVTVNSPYSISTGDSDWPQDECFGIGPAGGVTYTIALLDNLFLTAGTSLLYTSFEADETRKISVNASGYITSTIDERYKYSSWGNNTTITLALYIEPLSTSLILGGRFQYLKYYPVNDAPSLDDESFYGITFSVVYHI